MRPHESKGGQMAAFGIRAAKKDSQISIPRKSALGVASDRAS